MLNDSISNVFNFQQRLLFPHSRNHRCNSGSQIRTVHKHIVAEAFRSKKSLSVHTRPGFSCIFLLQSPQAAEWWLERHHFIDAYCSWKSSDDELFRQRYASATHLHEQFVMSLHLSVLHYIHIYTYIIYIYIYIYIIYQQLVIWQPEHIYLRDVCESNFWLSSFVKFKLYINQPTIPVMVTDDKGTV